MTEYHLSGFLCCVDAKDKRAAVPQVAGVAFV